ncbi:uncharacterized protein LOC143923100 [Arctopsyche grandis]|uniref:uncharacterized protein LOC143923100 n=1 Tax=Arctopsyche grandis TaxID=121162 RepID=UPI00406D7301
MAPYDKKKDLTKKIEENSYIYKDNINQGIVYILNELKIDIQSLKKNLESFGFIIKEFKTLFDFDLKIKTDTNDEIKFYFDFCTIVITITEKLISNETEIYESRNLEEIELITKFYNNNCKALKCKPKLFFFLEVPPKPKYSVQAKTEEKESDGSISYELPNQTDLFVYKHSSHKAVEDLCQLFQRLGDTKNAYFPDEVISHLCTMTKKPTIYDTLIRRLYLDKKIITVVDNNNLYQNKKLKIAIDHIEEVIGNGNKDFQQLFDELKLSKTRESINSDPNCDIENRDKIYKRVEDALNPNL